MLLERNKTLQLFASLRFGREKSSNLSIFIVPPRLRGLLDARLPLSELFLLLRVAVDEIVAHLPALGRSQIAGQAEARDFPDAVGSGHGLIAKFGEDVAEKIGAARRQQPH